MSLDTFLMPVVVLGLAVVGAIGTWFTLKSKSDQHGLRIVDLERGAEAAEIALRGKAEAVAAELAAYKLHVSDSYVRKDDLRQVEDRIAKRIDTVEHTVRNTATQIISALSGRRSASGRAE